MIVDILYRWHCTLFTPGSNLPFLFRTVEHLKLSLQIWAHHILHHGHTFALNTHNVFYFLIWIDSSLHMENSMLCEMQHYFCFASELSLHVCRQETLLCSKCGLHNVLPASTFHYALVSRYVLSLLLYIQIPKSCLHCIDLPFIVQNLCPTYYTPKFCLKKRMVHCQPLYKEPSLKPDPTNKVYSAQNNSKQHNTMQFNEVFTECLEQCKI